MTKSAEPTRTATEKYYVLQVRDQFDHAKYATIAEAKEVVSSGPVEDVVIWKCQRFNTRPFQQMSILLVRAKGVWHNVS